MAESTTVSTDMGVAEVYICSSPGCGKPANLACPSCVKLGRPPSRFCGQECFKASWNDHKAMHKVVKDPSTMPRVFGGFHFTGPLRPFQQSKTRVVPDEIMRPDYADHPEGLSRAEEDDYKRGSPMRVYSAVDIAGIREACRIGREVLDIGGNAVKVGVTCDEIDRVVHEATIERGAYPSPLNYSGFPKSVCTSVNEVICHGIPDLRELQDGDIVNVDVSVYYNGYHGDLNETFLVGSCDQRSVELVECAYNSLGAAIAIVKPGALYRDVGEAIAKISKAAKCSIVTSYCGHGIGTLFHTSPNVPHYPGNKQKGKMEVGHIFTIEPMINLGKSKDLTWPDNWTSTTVDGLRSSQFEHTMIVTETGVELLTARIGDPTDRLIWNKDTFQR
jgi:methionyl aminopeptidase